MNAVAELAYRKCTHRNFRRVEECATLIDWLDVQPGERILDVGCGDGYYDHEIAARGASVVGIDIRENALAVARSRNQTDRTEFHYMDAEAMGFPPASFDKVVSFCVIEHFRRDQQVIEHVSRVIKPGGWFVLSADSLSNPEVTEKERSAHQQRYAVNTFYTLDTLGKKLDAAGFDIVQHRYILTTPLTLAMVRLSWKLDDLPSALGPLGEFGYFLLNWVGLPVARAAEQRAGRADTGLTLLVKARKRASDGGRGWR